MPSNRTVTAPSVVSQVRDVTDETARALSRAAYEARKQTIAELESRKAEIKADLDMHNDSIAEQRSRARECQAQIDKLDEAIAAAKANG